MGRACRAEPSGSPLICIPNMEFTLQLTHLQPATYPITSCPPTAPLFAASALFLARRPAHSPPSGTSRRFAARSDVDADELASALSGNTRVQRHTPALKLKCLQKQSHNYKLKNADVLRRWFNKLGTFALCNLCGHVS